MRKKVVDYQAQRRTALGKIASQRAEAKKKLIKKLNPILTKYIEENGISIIVDKKNVVIGHADLDITNQIVEKLNKELPSLNLK